MKTKYPSKTLLYVEVIYMDGVIFKSRRAIHYDPNEAHKVYTKTVDKFTDNEQNVFVALRHENHDLIKLFRNF